MNFHEELFIHSFIIPQKRERYLSMFESKKGRRKLIQDFYHLNDLNEKYALKIPSNEQFVEKIFEMLKAKGATNNCYVISTNCELDAKELPLINVLNTIVGECSDGTFVSCIAGKLGYFEGESPDVRYIFQKND